MLSSTEKFPSLGEITSKYGRSDWIKFAIERKDLEMAASKTYTASFSGAIVADGGDKPVKLRTKVDMLARIKFLEERIELNNQAHQRHIEQLRYDHLARQETLQRSMNTQLLEILSNGVKEGSFPRRS